MTPPKRILDLNQLLPFEPSSTEENPGLCGVTWQNNGEPLNGRYYATFCTYNTCYNKYDISTLSIKKNKLTQARKLHADLEKAASEEPSVFGSEVFERLLSMPTAYQDDFEKDALFLPAGIVIDYASQRINVFHYNKGKINYFDFLNPGHAVYSLAGKLQTTSFYNKNETMTHYSVYHDNQEDIACPVKAISLCTDNLLCLPQQLEFDQQGNLVYPQSVKTSQLANIKRFRDEINSFHQQHYTVVLDPKHQMLPVD